MDPVTALERLGGAARWPALTALGVGRSTLLEAVRAGTVLRPARGVFALRFGSDEDRIQLLAARGQLSCGAAAEAHGLDVFAQAEQLHVRIPRGSSRVQVPARTILHPWGRSGSGDITTLADTVRDCARCLDRPDAVAVLDSALRSGRLTAEKLAAMARSWRGPARAAAGLVDPAAQSVLESVGRTVLALAEVGAITSQVHVPRVGWVDLVVEGWLVVELDGYATHRAAFHEDRRRDAELTRLGYVVLRFTYADLLHRRRWFVETVQETLDRGRPPFSWLGHRDDFATSDMDAPQDWAG